MADDGQGTKEGGEKIREMRKEIEKKYLKNLTSLPTLKQHAGTAFVKQPLKSGLINIKLKLGLFLLRGAIVENVLYHFSF